MVCSEKDGCQGLRSQRGWLSVLEILIPLRLINAPSAGSFSKLGNGSGTASPSFGMHARVVG
ncbi:hypothetical protein [Bartonella sp. AC134YNZD]|uniref:hypothetical protein n=1 Tax=Bartonella sp. AC134YNZD TaxID=3243446 RepID=UPI0035D03B70